MIDDPFNDQQEYIAFLKAELDAMTAAYHVCCEEREELLFRMEGLDK